MEHDLWLPCENNEYINTVHEALKVSKVSSLVTEDQNSWDVDLVQDIFSERDANLILTIPLQRTDNDSWFWRKDKLGSKVHTPFFETMQRSTTRAVILVFEINFGTIESEALHVESGL